MRTTKRRRLGFVAIRQDQRTKKILELIGGFIIMTLIFLAGILWLVIVG